jgi:hypothetical protein
MLYDYYFFVKIISLNDYTMIKQRGKINNLINGLIEFFIFFQHHNYSYIWRLLTGSDRSDNLRILSLDCY